MREHHAIVLRGAPERVYPLLRRVDLAGPLAVRVLLALRALPARLRGTRTGLRHLRLEDALRAGFVLLVEEPGREIVLGAIGRFWELDGRSRPVVASPDAFLAFGTPGYAKSAVNFLFERVPAGTRVSTETRVFCTDRKARLHFTRYWAVIGPFSGLIRRIWLRELRRAAERLA